MGVPKELLEKEGAVSSLVAEAMAKGIQKRASSHWGIGITGITQGPLAARPKSLLVWFIWLWQGAKTAKCISCTGQDPGKL